MVGGFYSNPYSIIFICFSPPASTSVPIAEKVPAGSHHQLAMMPMRMTMPQCLWLIPSRHGASQPMLAGWFWSRKLDFMTGPRGLFEWLPFSFVCVHDCRLSWAGSSFSLTSTPSTPPSSKSTTSALLPSTTPITPTTMTCLRWFCREIQCRQVCPAFAQFSP